MLTALDHVILAVRDLGAAERDYTRLLGLAPAWKGTHPDAGTANVLFALDNMYLELLAPDGDGPLGTMLRAWLDANGEGLVGLAFATGDLDACRETLAARGLDPGPIEAGSAVHTHSGAIRRWRRIAVPTPRSRGVVLFPIEHDRSGDGLPRSLPNGSAPAAVFALDHVVVQTTDGDATRALYGDALGLRLALDREFPDWGVRLLFFRVGGVTVEVAAALADADAAKAMPGGGRVDPARDRLYGMTWRVADIEGAHARLAAAGVEVSDVRTGRRPGSRVFTVRSSSCGVPTLMIAVDAEPR